MQQPPASGLEPLSLTEAIQGIGALLLRVEGELRGLRTDLAASFLPPSPDRSRGRGPRDWDRLQLGASAVLPLTRAAELLPMDDAAGRRWLAAQGLVRDLDGRDVVVWGDVVAALSPAANRGAPRSESVPPRLRRTRLA